MMILIVYWLMIRILENIIENILYVWIVLHVVNVLALLIRWLTPLR